jgi:hypothetical protein
MRLPIIETNDIWYCQPEEQATEMKAIIEAILEMIGFYAVSLIHLGISLFAVVVILGLIFWFISLLLPGLFWK